MEKQGGGTWRSFCFSFTSVVFNPPHIKITRKSVESVAAWNTAVWRWWLESKGTQYKTFFCPWSLCTPLLYSPLPHLFPFSLSVFLQPLQAKEGWGFLLFFLTYPHSTIDVQASWPRCHRHKGCFLNCKTIYVTWHFHTWYFLCCCNMPERREVGASKVEIFSHSYCLAM